MPYSSLRWAMLPSTDPSLWAESGNFVPKFVPDSTDLGRTQPNSLDSAGTNRQ